MRLFLKLVIIWTVISLCLGIAGRVWLREIWSEQREQAFRRVAAAAEAVVESQRWSAPAESDPAWRLLEQKLGVGLIPLDTQAIENSADPNSADGLATETNFSTEHQLDPPQHLAAPSQLATREPPVTWSRLADRGYRLSIQLPLESAEVGANALQISAAVNDSSIGFVWWFAWSLLSGMTYGLGWIGWWNIRRESRRNRRLLRPWFRALESRADAGTLLPQVEPQDSDFSLQMDSVANSVNRVYAELKNANDRAELVLGNLREGVLAVDDRFRILLANRAFRRLLDLPQENYLLRPLLEIVRTPVITKLAEKMVRDHVPAEEQVEFGTGPKHLRILARPLPFGNNRTGALITVRDETIIKRVDLIKRDFVANASHELKTPLAAIRAYAETLQLGALDDRDMAESFVGNIISQADRLDSLVQGMLQLSRVEVGSALKFQRFDAVEAIQSCIAAAEALARHKGVEVHVELPTSPVFLRSDRDGFQTIASNLLSNAVRYTDRGGAVTVGLRESPTYLMLEVRDTGIGMNEEELERVFERFYRVEKDRSATTGGTGLGLSIVKHLAQALGGKVHARSQLGKGSTFVVELPKSTMTEALEPGEELPPRAAVVGNPPRSGRGGFA